MKKILIITNKNKKGLFLRIAEKIFLWESVICFSGTEAESIIDSAKPDFVLLDFKKPVDGLDMITMDTLRHIDGNIRLRVDIFYLGLSKKELFKLKPSISFLSLKRAAE